MLPILDDLLKWPEPARRIPRLGHLNVEEDKMTGLVFSRRGECVRGLYLCFLVVLFLQFAGGASVAGVIYEYREEGGPEKAAPAIGTIEIKSPPARASGAWSTVDASDLLALFLDDAFFGLGSGNVLAMGGTLRFSGMTSLDGSTLDGGSLGITLPTVPPSEPGGPTVDRGLGITFDVLPGQDFIGGATVFRYPDGRIVIGDLWRFGDWVARPAIPEPSTLVLLAIGLSGVSWIGYRRRCRSGRA